MPSLTRSEAADRSALLTTVSYHVDLDLSTGPEIFRSATTIIFQANDQSQSTFLDVRPQALHSITLNGTDLDPAALTDGRFPLAHLAERNELVVVADMAYSTTAQGLHRAVDPANGKVYVYGSVFLDHAPRVFACFDQPDLKAPFTFVVTVPEDDWQVLGTGTATKREDGRWEVVQEVGQSTYLTTVVAGPYASFRTVHDGVPLGLHCRASVAAAVGADADEIFRVTGQCLDELHRLFGIRFPFPSFEQVFAPEFSFLSLDHPGCVLIKELYLFLTPVPRSEHETRAVVIAHGLSLQWLAGLVTNAWWNDVWLSQAFADYMAHRVPSEVTEFTGPLTTFAARRKGQAYVADQRPSTHPVAIEGKDALSALLDLDRISYFKGSSALRQLATHMGDERLREALRIYFDRHAYGSATYDDFNAALSEAAGRDMADWAQRWLMTPNVSTLGADLTIEDGRITAAAIVQEVPTAHPVHRPHTLDVGLYGPGDAHETVRVTVDGPRTELPQLTGKTAPDLVLVNENDRTYAKIRYDARSLAALPEYLPKLASINRGMVWCTLLMGVQDGTVAPADHLALVCDMLSPTPSPALGTGDRRLSVPDGSRASSLTGETELSIVIEVLEQARVDIADRYLDPALRPGLMVRVANACRERLGRVEKDDELGMPLLRGLIEFTADTAELRGWLDGTPLPAGIEPDADLAWRIRYRLAVLGEFDDARIEAAYQADPTTHAETFAAKCRAARPDAAAKEAAWQSITGDGSLSSYRLWALAEGFWQPEQHELTAPYVARFFEEMPKVATVHSDKVLDTLVLWLFPRYAATPRTLEHAEKFLAREDLPLALRRRAADQTDDLRRVVNTR